MLVVVVVFLLLFFFLRLGGSDFWVLGGNLVDVFERRSSRFSICSYVESEKIGGVRTKFFEVDNIDDDGVNELSMVLKRFGRYLMRSFERDANEFSLL